MKVNKEFLRASRKFTFTVHTLLFRKVFLQILCGNTEFFSAKLHLFADTVSGPDEIGTIRKELVYLSGKKQFVWGETSFIPSERSKNDLSDTVL